MPKNDNGISNRDSFKEDFDLGIYDFVLPRFAADFLQQFPTPSAAIAKFPRMISFSDFYSEDTLTTIDQVLSLSVEEADALMKAKSLVMELKDKLQSQNERRAGEMQVTTTKPEKQELDYKAILEQANFEDTTGWDMILIQMWNDGYSCVDVSRSAHVTIERVQNRKSEIRRMLGKKNGYIVLPKDKDRKAKMVKSRYTA
jgi:hypothetical protein